ncbi:zinc finger protein 726-like isoform X2 [Spodoptera litura]|uniref:Zinc finger protein 726-like isoform X2 n=1 Tax=Spodoptera litura TaxID=69820 RepID=A0A9J7DZ95_SPOLT|nr:zinc finger protein 726-like isoform X2 [Spodoptera litura]
MSLENWKLEKDLCRCCHNEGTFINLADPFTILGVTETYTNMLKECFDIDLSPIPGMLCASTYTICESCVTRLRDAVDFKKQVLTCEEAFRDLYNRNFIKEAEPIVQVEVKQEIPDANLDDVFKDSCPLDSGNDYVCVDSEDEMELRVDEQDEPSEVDVKSKKRKLRSNKKAQKNKSCRTERKSVKVESEGNSGSKKIGRNSAAAKFRLNDEDYKRDGDTYQCARCDKKYDKFYSLRFHVKTKHYKIPRFSCNICLKEFMTPAPLTVHKLEEHNIDDRFKCKACKGIFNTKIQLRKHINNFHMLGERYKCEFCEYESFSFEGMYKHKFKHKTVKDYHCRFCRKSFLRKTTLDLHERIHTGDRRKVCSVCGQAFVQKASLNYHMTKYHPEVNF